MKKKKVAVLLHGILRSWAECSTVFSYWNSLYEDIEFDFYLSTWKNSNIYPPDKGIPEDFLDNKDLIFKAYSVIDEGSIFSNPKIPPHVRYYYRDVIPTSKDRSKTNVSYPYAFLISDVFRLMNNSSIKYDACILTRPDCFIYKQVLDFIRNCIFELREPRFERLGHNIVYNQTGTTYHNDSLFIPHDIFWFGSQEAMSKFKDLFQDYFIDCKLKPRSMHNLQGEFLNYKGIYNCPIHIETASIVRSTSTGLKVRNPHKSHIKKLVTDLGSKLYEIPHNELRNNWFYQIGDDI